LHGDPLWKVIVVLREDLYGKDQFNAGFGHGEKTRIESRWDLWEVAREKALDPVQQAGD